MPLAGAGVAQELHEFGVALERFELGVGRRLARVLGIDIEGALEPPQRFRAVLEDGRGLAGAVMCRRILRVQVGGFLEIDECRRGVAPVQVREPAIDHDGGVVGVDAERAIEVR